MFTDSRDLYKIMLNENTVFNFYNLGVAVLLQILLVLQ